MTLALKNKFKVLSIALLLMFGSAHAAEQNVVQPLWTDWSGQTFQKARSEHKIVFLYLEAVWCHWCHVMQQQTLSDSTVREKLAKNFVSVKVDHDANPFLANRYRDWGWPALIFLAPDGSEIVKRAGFFTNAEFSTLLDSIVANPTPESGEAPNTEAAGPSILTQLVRQRLLQAHDENYDKKLGGLAIAQKFLDRSSIEFSMISDDGQQKRAQQTLTAGLQLIDPVWGGVYQYSTGGTWTQPHFEKIMRTQSGVLRLYSLAYARWDRTADRLAADAVVGYLLNFLRDVSGAFYVSQDADQTPGQKASDYFTLSDELRRRRGMPHIDRHLYADANGQAAEALASYADATGDANALDNAKTAAEWTLKHRALASGGFRHDKENASGTYLSDSLSMSRAMLALYRSTAERIWLERSEKTARFITGAFRDRVAGYVTAVPDGSPVTPTRNLEENVQTIRLLNLLYYYTGQSEFRSAALHGVKFLSSETIAQKSFEEAGILLVDDELRREPVHLTVVGSKNDPSAKALYAEALRNAGGYARVEWWDAKEGPLPNPDVSYPQFSRAAGFLCTATQCSSPSFDAPKYRQRIVSTSMHGKKPF